jgi:hypothetical protein
MHFVLGLTQPRIQWVPGALSLQVKRPGREADHSPPSSAEVKNALSYTSTSQYVFLAWCLVKHRENFIFLLYILHFINFYKISYLLFTTKCVNIREYELRHKTTVYIVHLNALLYYFHFLIDLVFRSCYSQSQHYSRY